MPGNESDVVHETRAARRYPPRQESERGFFHKMVELPRLAGSIQTSGLRCGNTSLADR